MHYTISYLNKLFLDYNNVKLDKTRLEHFLSLFRILQEYFSNEYLPNHADMLSMYGKVC